MANYSVNSVDVHKVGEYWAFFKGDDANLASERTARQQRAYMERKNTEG
ncbi:hypothetical protein [Candidatus Endoriftia persephone]|jgi:hypothetical protein|uniref:Uncharacterized protein n=1 Tax=Candidatus Endoriftia persephonae TaxID=393765 RepID=A0A9J6ZWU3_9GAMM|nr:hypothetical protein [Candidatus Endoriftia persephone]USF87275.1 hypothetical protein L0Y14_14240 [Candidatus Endoriftia persephone]